jgi:hypothetical protein
MKAESCGWRAIDDGVPRDVEVLVSCEDGRVYTAISPDVGGPPFFCLTVGRRLTDLDTQWDFPFKPTHWHLMPRRDNYSYRKGAFARATSD